MVVIVFVPFLGDFLSITSWKLAKKNSQSFRPLSWGLSFNLNAKMDTIMAALGFRPLSWGLSFNQKMIRLSRNNRYVFVPFLGDFLSITG